MVPNLFYTKSHFFNIIIIGIINIVILIFLLLIYFLLSCKATESTIFQHFKAKFDQHTFS